MSSARCSSFFRLAVTFGAGVAAEIWLSISSKMMFRTWLVFFAMPFLSVSPGTSGFRLLSPLYSASRRSIFTRSPSQYLSLSASLCCQVSSFPESFFLPLSISFPPTLDFPTSGS